MMNLIGGAPTGKCNLWVILALSVMVCGCANFRKTPTQPSFRVMTYNIHHGEGLDGKVDLARIAALIKAEGADIVALQEVDKGVARTDRRDLPAELAALTGMTAVFSNNFHFQGGEYGNALLTRFPIRHATNSHYQMLRVGEQRGLLQATLSVQGRPVVLMNTHIDYRGDDSERWLNVGEIETFGQPVAGMPVILCGDFNDTPDSRVHQRLSQTFFDVWQLVGPGDGFTFPVQTPRKRIDYIWLSKAAGLTPVKVWIPDTEASDHLPVVAEFQWR